MRAFGSSFVGTAKYQQHWAADPKTSYLQTFYLCWVVMDSLHCVLWAWVIMTFQSPFWGHPWIRWLIWNSFPLLCLLRVWWDSSWWASLMCSLSSPPLLLFDCDFSWQILMLGRNLGGSNIKMRWLKYSLQRYFSKILICAMVACLLCRHLSHLENCKMFLFYIEMHSQYVV